MVLKNWRNHIWWNKCAHNRRSWPPTPERFDIKIQDSSSGEAEVNVGVQPAQPLQGARRARLALRPPQVPSWAAPPPTGPDGLGRTGESLGHPLEGPVQVHRIQLQRGGPSALVFQEGACMEAGRCRPARAPRGGPRKSRDARHPPPAGRDALKGRSRQRSAAPGPHQSACRLSPVQAPAPTHSSYKSTSSLSDSCTSPLALSRWKTKRPGPDGCMRCTAMPGLE